MLIALKVRDGRDVEELVSSLAESLRPQCGFTLPARIVVKIKLGSPATSYNL